MAYLGSDDDETILFPIILLNHMIFFENDGQHNKSKIMIELLLSHRANVAFFLSRTLDHFT